MKDSGIRRYEMFKRVRDFGDTHAASFPAGTLGYDLFATVAAVVAELDTHMAAEASGHKDALGITSTKAALRALLYDDLMAICRTARAMAYETPGLEDKFRMPRHKNDHTMLAVARAFATDAVPFVQEFIRHEMAVDFLQDLTSDIAIFEQAINAQSAASGARVAMSAATDAAIDRGVDATRRLEAVVRNKFRNNSALLAAWETATHVVRMRRSHPNHQKHDIQHAVQ